MASAVDHRTVDGPDLRRMADQVVLFLDRPAVAIMLMAFAVQSMVFVCFAAIATKPHPTESASSQAWQHIGELYEARTLQALRQHDDEAR